MAQAEEAAVAIREFALERGKHVKLWGVPRGGIPAAFAIHAILGNCSSVVEFPEDADVIVDDLIDSGATMNRYQERYPDKPFVVLYDKRVQYKGEWLVFPWEGTHAQSADDIVTRLLQYIGEDPERGGLKETPARVLKAWGEWCAGYKVKPEEVLKTFDDGAERVDEMVVVRDIPIYSHCEHHLAPFFGVAHVAYVPNGKIAGLSKLARLVDVFAHRLQVQERLTNQVADALTDGLQPLGVGVIMKCRHLCMESRGIRRPGATTVTSALRGVFRTEPSARTEFMALAR